MQFQIPGYTYRDLFDPRRLAGLTELFEEEIHVADPALHARYMDYRAGRVPGGVQTSKLLVDLAPRLGGFLARAFGIEREYAAMKLRAQRDAVIFRVKRDFFTRRVLKKYGAPGLIADDPVSIERRTRIDRRPEFSEPS